MKFYIMQLVKVPMLLVFFLMIIFFGFAALGSPAEIDQYAVVTAIGIDKDKEEDGYELSFLTFVPVAEQTFTERYKIISAKGKDVSEAIDFAGMNIGRQIGLSHLKLIVLSQDIANENMFEFLDYVTRIIQLPLSTKLVMTHDDSAKDFLKAAQTLDSDSSIKVSEIITYNSNYIFSVDSSLETFFKGSFGPTRVGVISCLTSQQRGEQALSTASGGGASGSEGQGGGQNENQNSIENIMQCHVDVFKDGKFVNNFTAEEVEKINMVQGDFETGTIEIEHFTDKYFTDADVAFEITSKDQKYKATFQNGIPVINIDTKFDMRLSEVRNNNGETIKENVEFFSITPEAKREIEKKVRKFMGQGISILRDYQIDIPDFYTLMHNSNKNEFTKFLADLEDEDDYLNHVVFKISVRVFLK